MKRLALARALALCVQLSCLPAHAQESVPTVESTARDLDSLAQVATATPLELKLDSHLTWPTPEATKVAAWPPASRQEFLAAVWPHAERVAKEIGVTPHALVAQAALESGWGRRAVSVDGQPTFNLFGIKAGPAWTGDRYVVATHEYVHGKARLMYADFRAYESIADAFDDYLRMLRANHRYAAALKHGGTSRHFATRLQKAGYSTDPHYAAKVHRIANSPIVRAVPHKGRTHRTPRGS